MLAEYKKISPEDAWEELVQQLGADDLNALEQRPAYHPGQSQVRAGGDLRRVVAQQTRLHGKDLITCVTLTPYQ